MMNDLQTFYGLIKCNIHLLFFSIALRDETSTLYNKHKYFPKSCKNRIFSTSFLNYFLKNAMDIMIDTSQTH